VMSPSTSSRVAVPMITFIAASGGLAVVVKYPFLGRMSSVCPQEAAGKF